MLSNAAWNAFLKTLEEPPPHVKFIFATTEVHKVPVTILSRCQRYDFKLIAHAEIARAPARRPRAEKIEAEDAAVAVLAREAAGSMRDAMSLLDQVIAYGGTTLTAEDVARVLGVADRAVLHELATALVAGDAAATLKRRRSAREQGFDLVHVAKDVLRHLRDLVVAKVCGEGADRELLDLADEEVADVRALAAKADGDDLQRLFQGFSRSFDDISKSGQPRTALEMTLVRLARRPALLPLDELLARLGELEKRLATGAPPPAGAARWSGGGGGGGDVRGRGAPGGGPQQAAPPAPMFAPPEVGRAERRSALDARVARPRVPARRAGVRRARNRDPRRAEARAERSAGRGPRPCPHAAHRAPRDVRRLDEDCRSRSRERGARRVLLRQGRADRSGRAAGARRLRRAVVRGGAGVVARGARSPPQGGARAFRRRDGRSPST